MWITEKTTKLADKIIELLIKENCTIADEEDILSEIIEAVRRSSMVQRADFQKKYQEILKREAKEKDKQIIEINTSTATCISKHIQAYVDQSSENKPADFGVPCADCIYAKQCECDWYAKMKPILDRADNKFQLCTLGDKK